ncbi:MAG TPA: PAS domain-containing protein, partial [Opitutaceae bacterium]|nr:PAS domain-containing protein [Opitutaceae bacterium]
VFPRWTNGGYLALGALAAALALLRRRHGPVPVRHDPYPFLSVVALATAGAAGVAFVLQDSATLPGPFGPAPFLAACATLFLVGLGLIWTRPHDPLPTVLFSRTAAGVLARWLLLGVLLSPVIVTTAFVVRRGGMPLSLADGAALLTLVYLLIGLAAIMFAIQIAAVLDDRRQNAESTRELLTARLQEQAAQLQEIVARRTQELESANARLQALNQSLELATQAAALGIWEWDAVTQRSVWDRRTLEIYGLKEFNGTIEAWMERIHPDDRTIAQAAFEQLRQGHGSYALDCRIVRPDGVVRYVESRALVQRDPRGRVQRLIGTERDITAQVESSLRTRQLNERLQLALRSSNFGVWEYDIQTGVTHWDDRVLEIYGLQRHQFTGEPGEWSRFLHPDDRAATEAAFDLVLQRGAPTSFRIFRIVRPDGAVRYVEGHGHLQRDADGRPVRVVGLNRDITGEQALHEALHMAEQRWQLAIEGTNDAVWDWDIERHTVFHDERWTRMLGYQPGEIESSVAGWRLLVHPDDQAASDATAEAHLAGRTPLYQAEYRMRAKDGGWRWILDRGKVVKRSPAGDPLRMVGTHTDITARRDLEQRLRRTDELADQVSRIAHIGGWDMELDTGRITWSAEVCRIHDVGEDYRPTLDDVRRFFPLGVLEALQAGDPSALGATFDHQLALITAKGRHIWVRVIGRAEPQPGGSSRVHGALQDVTIQHEMESNRRQLEVQLFQAQKMETLGTLSGGIAHDFNNLLTGIIGYHELAADSVPEDHPARACLAEARNASLRARELVEQILTFSRQTSETEHGAVDLGLVVEEARRFLRATLPANISIETDLDPDCGPVLADATQIYQVILNLGSNAAHAMRAHGGTLRLSLHPADVSTTQGARFGGVSAGRYLRLSMADTGHGMDEATQRRIFEPFFTTKNTREGTGLGLAVVHGIIRAHRGAIDLESKVNVGTTFHVYLPMSPDQSGDQAEESQPTPTGAGELVCVVDDEGIVGRYTKATIEKLGYRAVAYGSAEECLAAWQAESAEYRVLVTDQTMPGLQGTELAAALRKQIPGLPVVIMSGYFSKISSHALDELGQVELLAKPFTTEQLAQALHAALAKAPRRERA